MTNSLTDLESEHLLNFIGYGRFDADVWFLGTNEAVGKEANIQARPKFQPVEDKDEVHKVLGITYLHLVRRKMQGPWWGMCFIVLWLKGQEPARENIRAYLTESLDRSNSKTLLNERRPITKQRLFAGYLEV